MYIFSRKFAISSNYCVIRYANRNQTQKTDLQWFSDDITIVLEIKLSIQAMPINRYSQRLRDRIQNDYVAKDSPKLFGIVYSCQKYLDRAKIVHEKIRSSITSKIIVGNPDQQELS